MIPSSRSRLERRYDALEGRLQLSYWILDESKSLSLDVSKVATPEKLRELRDALLLTGVQGASFLSNREWIRELDTIGVDGIFEASQRVKISPRYSFALGGPRETREFRPLLDWDSLRNLFGYEDHDDEYESDCQHLHDEFTSFLKHPEFSPIPIELSFWPPSTLTPMDQVEYLERVKMAITKTLEHCEDQKQRHFNQPRFELGAIELHLGSFCVTAAIVGRLQEILTLDMTVKLLAPPTHTEFMDIELTGWHDAWASMLLTICGHPHASTRPAHPIETLELTQSELSDDMYQAFCSVIAHATSVQKLSMNDSLRETPSSSTRWKWLLYALFSKASTTSIRSVSSTGGPLIQSSGDMDIGSMVNAKFPQTQLLGDSTPAHDSPLGSVRLEHGARFELASDPSVAVPVQEPSGQVFDVIRMDPSSAKMDILVPGYGHCLVDRASHEEKIIRSPELSERFTSRGWSVQELSLDDSHQYNPDGNSLCVRLLPYIGRRITSLRVFAERQNSAHLTPILTNCPFLESLDLAQISRGYLQPLPEALDRPDCRLKSLRFVEWSDRDEASLLAVLEKIAEPSTVVAKRLRKLVVNGDTSFEVSSSPTVARMMVQVVRHNKSLEYIDALLTPADWREYDRAMNEGRRRPLSRLERRRLEQMGQVIEEEIEEEDVYTRKVQSSRSIRTKCAFLSVSSHQPSLSLDLHTTSLIFEYLPLPEPIERTVVIRVGED
ncbi:hypothetical protein Poli38472_011168 [Pythium oligandrum]|uniref:Uncharacterized protein n=1 Tax=Pythium oligandrum TaxID=41045 RepID=A0A8K1CRA8_PYTOL|nr:hypothetical protein Poli38472_011168 [Pythium oligandrum]|eukprot:TMW67548.1 hypothetical protein Poli38472_011168 [Pythium oligandrum]